MSSYFFLLHIPLRNTLTHEDAVLGVRFQRRYFDAIDVLIGILFGYIYTTEPWGGRCIKQFGHCFSNYYYYYFLFWQEIGGYFI